MPSRDLVARTLNFATEARRFVNELPRSVSNYEDARQLIRASGSVAANYIEAQEGLSRRDFFYRIRICRKEARESGLWLRLLNPGTDAKLIERRDRLFAESDELKRIFAAISARDEHQVEPGTSCR